MRANLVPILILAFSLPVFGFTTTEYFSLAPELVSAMNTSWVMIYTICTGSFVSFYFFGWSSNWIIRVCGGLLFLSFINGAIGALAIVYNTWFESLILYLASTNVCDPKEVAEILYATFDTGIWCNSELAQIDFAGLEVGSSEYKNILRSVAQSFYENGAAGYGLSFSVQGSAIPFSNIGIMLSGSLLNGLASIAAVLIWFICPPRSYFVKRGWIKES